MWYVLPRRENRVSSCDPALTPLHEAPQSVPAVSFAPLFTYFERERFKHGYAMQVHRSHAVVFSRHINLQLEKCVSGNGQMSLSRTIEAKIIPFHGAIPIPIVSFPILSILPR